MRVVYLVRHCEYENPDNIFPGRLPVPLSKSGFARAQKLHDYFVDKNIQAIYSSPVLRCKQTSESISDGSIPIVHDVRLAETFSAYQGYKVQGDLTNDSSWLEYHSHVDELGGETFADLTKRVMDFFSAVIVPGTGNVIICSHQDPLYALYCELAHKPLAIQNIEIARTMESNGAQPKGSVYPVTIHDDGTYAVQSLVEMSL
jgi:broad specificity phosphatase PhoE